MGAPEAKAAQVPEERKPASSASRRESTSSPGSACPRLSSLAKAPRFTQLLSREGLEVRFEQLDHRRVGELRDAAEAEGGVDDPGHMLDELQA